MVSSTIIKAVLISTGIITAMSMFLKPSVPMALDFSISFPILWSSFLSCLKPPYNFVVVNVIISTIIVFSRYYRSIGDLDGQEENTLHGGYYKIQTEPIFNQAPPRRLEVKDVDFDFDFDSDFDFKVKKALRVVKPKQPETLENTWKIIPEEGTSTPLVMRPDTFGLGPGGDVKPALRKSETFRDVNLAF